MAIKGGYYIKSRSIRDSWIAHSAPIDREVWDYLMREANHEDKKYGGFTIKRGQLFRSYRDIREALHWKAGCCKKFYSESAMKRCMKRLREALMVELVCEPRGNLITICNYDYYQDPKNYERTSVRTIQRTCGEPVANQERTAINKNVKELKNDKKSINLVEREELFKTQFWGTYPKRKGKRVGKAKSLKIFLKIPEEKISKVITGVRKLSAYCLTTSSYPKDPERWLRDELWEDWQFYEPEPKKETGIERALREEQERIAREGI